MRKKDLSVGVIEEKLDLVEKEIQIPIVGMRKPIGLVLIGVFSDPSGHLLFEGVPGIGKTYLAKTIATVTGLDFSRIQFKPDLRPKDLIGYVDLKGNFRKGPLFAQLVLGDEINRASPKTQSALLDAMEENLITTEEVGIILLEQPYIIIATQNQIESRGEARELPEAQQDRFLFKVRVGYPSTEEAEEINRRKENELIVRQVVSAEEIIAMREWIKKNVKVSDKINTQAVAFAELSRPEVSEFARDMKVKVGASPRGHINLVKASRVVAVRHGRDYVLPSDLMEIASPVFFTRVFFERVDRLSIYSTFEKLMEGILEELFFGDRYV